MTSKWLSQNYLHKYKCISTITLSDIKDLIKEDLKLKMAATQIRRAKLMTTVRLKGNFKEEFVRLWDYL